MLDYNFVREKMGENPDLEERDRRFDAAVAGTGSMTSIAAALLPAAAVEVPILYFAVTRRNDALPSVLPRWVWKEGERR